MQCTNVFFCFCGILLFAPNSADGQPAQPDRLKFEVASVKPSSPRGRSNGLQGGPGTSDPERLTFTGSPLLRIIIYAYGIRADELSAPNWLSSALYDIAAKVPPGATREQSQQMLRNLLTERFHLAVHHETRDFPAYNLTTYKGKPKLAPSSAEHVAAHASTDKEPGTRVSAHDTRLVMTGFAGIWRIRGEGATLADLAGSLSAQAGRRVVDKTELSGRFDFNLEFSRSLGSQSDAAPYILDALREQLGLDLQETQVPLDVVVVDRIDRTPTEN